jgi:hypothetical protein
MRENIEEVRPIVFITELVCLTRGRSFEAREEMKSDSGRG